MTFTDIQHACNFSSSCEIPIWSIGQTITGAHNALLRLSSRKLSLIQRIVVDGPQSLLLAFSWKKTRRMASRMRFWTCSLKIWRPFVLITSREPYVQCWAIATWAIAAFVSFESPEGGAYGMSACVSRIFWFGRLSVRSIRVLEDRRNLCQFQFKRPWATFAHMHWFDMCSLRKGWQDGHWLQWCHSTGGFPSVVIPWSELCHVTCRLCLLRKAGWRPRIFFFEYAMSTYAL
jgi:hypothetical protein